MRTYGDPLNGTASSVGSPETASLVQLLETRFPPDQVSASTLRDAAHFLLTQHGIDPSRASRALREWNRRLPRLLPEEGLEDCLREAEQARQALQNSLHERERVLALGKEAFDKFGGVEAGDMAASSPVPWLVEGVLARGQPALIAGPEK